MGISSKKGPFVFEFLHRYARGFQYTKVKTAEIGKEFFGLEKSQEIKGYLSLLPTDLSTEDLYEDFINQQRLDAIKKLRTYKKKVKNEIAPLANFYNETLEALKTFQQEIRESQAS